MSVFCRPAGIFAWAVLSASPLLPHIRSVVSVIGAVTALSSATEVSIRAVPRPLSTLYVNVDVVLRTVFAVLMLVIDGAVNSGTRIVYASLVRWLPATSVAMN